jgi:DNA-binding MarR family transcriptional regulator
MVDEVKGTIAPTVEGAIRAFFRLLTMAEPISFELWRRHELTLGQVRLLQRLRREPMLAGDLAKELEVRATSLTRMMERLESEGLVERTLDRDDRRRILVSLTDKGRKVLGGLDFWRESPVLKAILAMDEGERIRLTETFDSLIAHIRDASEGDSGER